jgi:hypothetical protein
MMTSFDPSSFDKLRMNGSQDRRAVQCWFHYLAKAKERQRDHIRAQILRLRMNGLKQILPCILRAEVKGYKIRGGVKRRSILP